MKLRAVLIALSLALAGGIPSLITAAGTVALSDRMIIRQEDLSSAAPVPCQNPHTGSELAFSGLVTLPSSTR